MKLLFLGDFYYDFPEIAGDIDALAEEVRARGLSTVINLEGVLCDPSGLKPIRKRGARLAQSEQCLEALLRLNTVAVTLANNHTMDYGPEGLSEMRKTLEGAGIRTVGAGNNLTEAVKPLIMEDGETKLALFNFGWGAEETVYAKENRPGCAPREEKVILPALRSLQETEPGLPAVVLMHWGYEFNPYPMPVDITLASHLTALPGVQAVIGHHPHCVQPVTQLGGKPVWFSLGNFYFSSRRAGFAKKFDHTPDNLCDYGLGVIFDTETGVTETLGVVYDRETGKSRLMEELSFLPLMPKSDPESPEYRKFAKEQARNSNPVLKDSGFSSRITAGAYNTYRNLKKHFGGLSALLGNGR
ncbi:MAG: CapA family protein [Lachnospiraceae bacterium]|nr:CapA family protein [Lachnospiraceae bacterium]